MVVDALDSRWYSRFNDWKRQRHDVERVCRLVYHTSTRPLGVRQSPGYLVVGTCRLAVCPPALCRRRRSSVVALTRRQVDPNTTSLAL